MKNKHLALLMAVIMCFSLMFGAAAVTEGEQVIPSTSQISPTATTDMIDEIVSVGSSAYGDELSNAGDNLMNEAEKAHGFLSTFMRMIDTFKVLFANLVNTIFPFFNIGTGGIFG
ncbi:MAG: hypothetical protein IKV21_03235 [Clostridia bacterium]|nr:hypothetical protein [Clostridia bacterium]